MLIEIRCDKFRKNPIRLRSRLNVVLGDENATNSIGKSTLLMVIDFAFGGTSLLAHNKDLVPELGEHNYFFKFRFGGEVLIFRRGTSESSIVYHCNEELEPTRPIEVEKYTALLKRAYAIYLPDISFRQLAGLYIRVWGKDNLSVDRPLHLVQAQPGHECVDNLIKTFDQYESIRELSKKIAEADDEAKAFRSAKRHEIIPTIGKRDYANNQKQIDALQGQLEEIRANLASYATNLSEVVNQEVLDLKFEKDRLLAVKQTLAGRLQRIQRNLQDNRKIRSDSFKDLINFFPEVNEERVTKIEDFHNGVAKLLRTELKESGNQIERQIEQVEAAIATIEEGMRLTLRSVDQPSSLVDRVVEVAIALKSNREANARFETEIEIQEKRSTLRTQLTEEKSQVLAAVEGVANEGMRGIVDSVFGRDRKSPKLALRENSYSFEVYDDTGTGTAYASLLVFDLMVFLSTRLPIVVHDSLLFKNIENDSVAQLLRVYMASRKQSFIAIDEIEKYGPLAAKFLRRRSVINLDNVNLLYVKDWRV
jgi:uncharacterized protein YydD (DUF2326 family)